MNTVTHAIPGLVIHSHRFELPVDYAQPNGAKISVFAREVIAPGKAHADLPYLVFFQGGPGSGAPRPMGNTGWLKRALQEFRVLLLDHLQLSRQRPRPAR